jgi:iron complex outermembrane receptor protein
MTNFVRPTVKFAGYASVLALSLTAFASGNAFAQDTAQAKAKSGASVEEVVVTATRREEKLQDVPLSAAVLTGLKLDVLGSSGLDSRALAFSVPSLNVESSNGRTFPRFYIRGYGNTDFTSFASQPVGLVYDDIVQENPALKGFPIFDQADLEVLRGPQGTLFGRNSPAGVVKLQSAAPVLGERFGSVSASDGTYNAANFTGMINIPIGDKIAVRIAGQLQHRDNWVNDPITKTDLMGYDDFAARAQLLYKPSEEFNALFNVHGRSLDGQGVLFRANIIQPGTNKLVAGFDPEKFYGDGIQTANYGSVGANVHLNWIMPNVTLQSITGYESITNYFTQGDIDGGFGAGFFAGAPSGPGFIPFGVETAGGIKSHYQLTQEFRAITTLSGPWQGQLGIFLFDEDTQAFGNDYDITGKTLVDTTISRQKNDAEAVFGSVEYTATSALKLHGGLRYTSDHKEFSVPFTNVAGSAPSPLSKANASNLSWDASATYTVAPDVNLYARAATGFRAPSFGAPIGGLPTQYARSESNTSYEIGIKTELFERRARFNFDLFHYDVKNQQLTAVGGLANTTQLLNAKKTTGQGAEAELEAHLSPNLVVNISGSYNDTKIKDPTLAVGPCFNWSFLPGGQKCTELNPLNKNGFALINGNSLPEAAKYIGDLSLRYDYPLSAASGLYLFTDWSYRSSMQLFLDKEKEFTAPSLYQMGLRVGYTWDNGKYEVAAFCRNCTDNVKLIYGINFDNFTGIINDPRIVGGQVTVKF